MYLFLVIDAAYKLYNTSICTSMHICTDILINLMFDLSYKLQYIKILCVKKSVR